ncbi:hypothetical protein [Micromonospora sp. CB01531]|uniref:hypothetical protein n=1 Tax=Micromonospora sp. CB01531 TaxID=1718947 RepID=UPI00093F2213|nr:hypothetical protein [Micromonospora sp. CB01531]OKI47518.1 hypothetical protein A6A27_36720 [Micromonospora sp. CB01531]
MATTAAGRVRTATGTAVLAALILVIAFGNPAYTDWAKNHTSNDAWGFFLKQLAWPTWSFSSDESVRTILANDIKAILLIVLTGVFVSLMVAPASPRSARLFFSSWGAYIFAAASAGLLAAFIQVDASLRGAFDWAAGGGIYGLFVGWVLAIVVFASRK